MGMGYELWRFGRCGPACSGFAWATSAESVTWQRFREEREDHRFVPPILGLHRFQRDETALRAFRFISAEPIRSDAPHPLSPTNPSPLPGACARSPPVLPVLAALRRISSRARAAAPALPPVLVAGAAGEMSRRGEDLPPPGGGPAKRGSGGPKKGRGGGLVKGRDAGSAC
ncbi:hypothetical protein PVAP13_9NG455814 [Panicum virgatum]|uniref:Uncharacterized protein n=1 Tax=Panicum virgatum TaxID=38727 RepID=A0A8T0MW23_PANVG|nr:hypothetical protein PVAP13_9NG455814 [Panicum virgatum]